MYHVVFSFINHKFGVGLCFMITLKYMKSEDDFSVSFKMIGPESFMSFNN